jgi:hypothetical protein
MTTKRTVIFESFVVIGSFDCDHTHMSLLTCPPLPYLSGKFDHEQSNVSCHIWPNWPSEVITKHGLFDQVMFKKTLKSG